MSEKTTKAGDGAKLSVEEVLKKLDTSVDGLSNKEAKERLKHYGLNEIVEKHVSPVDYRDFSESIQHEYDNKISGFN